MESILSPAANSLPPVDGTAALNMVGAKKMANTNAKGTDNVSPLVVQGI
jgi:hypothetical protein